MDGDGVPRLFRPNMNMDRFRFSCRRLGLPVCSLFVLFVVFRMVIILCLRMLFIIFEEFSFAGAFVLVESCYCLLFAG